MAIESLIIDTDNVIELSAFQNETDDSYINDATVTVTLLTMGGTEVSGGAWPLTMSYVAASDGIYRATLPDTLALKPNKRYLAKVIADGGSGLRRTWYHWTHAVRG